MVKEIIHDPILLSMKSSPAGVNDIAAADDLKDTLRANSERCVGMAANMIGISKRIIVFIDNGEIFEMFNPEIIEKKGRYTAEEGCLSLSGRRETERFRSIKVKWQNREFKTRIKTFSGFTAQIIQHETDHCNGILI